MPTTSSATSARPSTGSRNVAVAAWGFVAALFIAQSFAGQIAGGDYSEVFYRYETAASQTVVFAFLVAITFGIAAALGRPVTVVGLRSFSWKWLWVALGLIVLVLGLSLALEGVLHGGEEQGLAPEVWRPDRAWAFVVNGIVVATVGPFAEELFFRGVGIRALLPFGGITAIAVTAIVFGLSHGVLAALPVLVPFGLALGWVRWRSQSVWPAVIAHGFYNGTLFLAVYLTLAD
jgi:uncharacterized protein